MSNTCTRRVPALTSHDLRRPLGRAAFALLVLLAFASWAGAQAPRQAERHPPVRRWDASAGVGVRFFDEAGLGHSYSNWSGHWQPRVQVGRYLTPHLKLEFAVVSPVTHQFFEDEIVPVSGLSAPVYAFSEHRSRVVSVAPLLTWQFLDNAFAHPFVSAGLDIGVLEEHINRGRQTRQTNGLAYTVPAANARRDGVLVRPLVAAGFKSYFNERVFAHPEGSLAFGRPGVSQFTLRLDVGVDF